MKVQVRLLIISVDESNDKVYVNTDVNLFPFGYVAPDEQPKQIANEVLLNVCGVSCLEDEFIFSDCIYTEDDTLFLTYGVMIPYGLSDKNVELNEFLGRDMNEMDKKIVEQMAYTL